MVIGLLEYGLYPYSPNKHQQNAIDVDGDLSHWWLLLWTISTYFHQKKPLFYRLKLFFHRIVFIKTCIKVKAAAGNRLVFRTKPNTVISKMTKVKSIGIHVGNSLELMIFFLINKTIRLFIFFLASVFFMNRTKQEKEPILFINLSTHLSDILIHIFFPTD